MKIIECVPNFSEGKDHNIITSIADSIEAVSGITLLDVNPGADTNRTVVTFVGPPEDVIDAAFMGIKMASEVIDMNLHSGAHARMGATDVCPLVPISNTSMDECVQYSIILAKRVGKELKPMNSMMVMFFCLDVPLQERSGSFKCGSVKRLGSIEEAQRQETLKMPSEWRKNTTSPFK